MWDFSDGKQYRNRENPQNSWRTGGDILENFSGKEHAEWDFASYKDIMSGVFSQRKYVQFLCAPADSSFLKSFNWFVFRWEANPAAYQ